MGEVQKLMLIQTLITEAPLKNLTLVDFRCPTLQQFS